MNSHWLSSVAMVRAVFATALVATALLGLGGSPTDAASGGNWHALHGTDYFGDGIQDPGYVAGDGTNLWVANFNPETVTKLSGSTGAVEAITPVPSNSSNPNAIAVDVAHVWVVSYYGGQLTELSRATGAVLSVLSIPGPPCPCDEPFPLTAIADDGTHVWVAQSDPPYAGTLVELDAATGAIVRSATFGSSGNPFQTMAVHSDGTDVWVATRTGVDEFSVASGALVQSIPGPGGDLAGGSGITTDGTRVWVTTANSVVELSESTGSFIRSISTPALVGGEAGMSSDGMDLWIALPNGVIEIAEASGTVMQTLSGAKYGIEGASGVVSNGTDVWVMDDSPGSFTELSASTGQLRHPVSAAYDLPDPMAVAAGGAHVWVLGSDFAEAAGSLTELSSTTGRQTRFFGGRHHPLGWPCQLIDDGPNVWVLVLRAYSPAIIEFSTTTGARLREITVAGGEGDQPSFALSKGRLWVLASPLTSLAEYSAFTGRYLDSIPDSKIGLPNGISAITASAGQVIATGPNRLAVLSGTSGRLVHLHSLSPHCSVLACVIKLAASATSVWAWIDGSSGSSLREFSLATGVTQRTLTAQSTGLSYLGPPSVTGGALWVVGKTGESGVNQGWVLEQRSLASGSLEHTFTGGKLGFQGPGYAAVLGSEVWVPNSAGDAVTEFQNRG